MYPKKFIHIYTDKKIGATLFCLYIIAGGLAQHVIKFY